MYIFLCIYVIILLIKKKKIMEQVTVMRSHDQPNAFSLISVIPMLSETFAQWIYYSWLIASSTFLQWHLNGNLFERCLSTFLVKGDRIGKQQQKYHLYTFFFLQESWWELEKHWSKVWIKVWNSKHFLSLNFPLSPHFLPYCTWACPLPLSIFTPSSSPAALCPFHAIVSLFCKWM